LDFDEFRIPHSAFRISHLIHSAFRWTGNILTQEKMDDSGLTIKIVYAASIVLGEV